MGKEKKRLRENLTAATRVLRACREKSASVDSPKRPIVPRIDPNQKDR
jgi:hypothetical protein